MTTSPTPLLLLLTVVLSLAAAKPHLIESLPGLKEPLPFDMYSGYVTVDEKAGRNLFYWFVQSEHPATDPVVLWLTGGPGCSGLFALLTEHGPVFPAADGQSLVRNPNSWNRAASIIYVEAPCGVGFSYAQNQNYTTGDDQTATDNAQFVLRFFAEEFPHLRSNAFYIAGESYGGHYVPMLAAHLASNLMANFKGFLVGNPSTDHHYDYNSFYPFMAAHALVDAEVYAYAQSVCGTDWFDPKNLPCVVVTKKIRAAFDSINPYDVYAECLGPDSNNGGCLTSTLTTLQQVNARGTLSQTVIPCIDVTPSVTYMNLPAVRAALAIAPEVASRTWEPCSQILTYNQFLPTMLPIYSHLLQTYTHLRVLVYSGDVDSCVPYSGTEAAIDTLPFVKTQPWRAWKVDAQVAGYVKGWLSNRLRYATVKGSGHMVPTFKPVQALAMFKRFLNEEPL